APDAAILPAHHAQTCLVLNQSERRVNVGISRPEPVAETRAKQASRRARRASFEDKVLAVEKVCRITRIEREWLETFKGLERCRRPLPAVADHLRNTELVWLGSGHGDRVPASKIHVLVLAGRASVVRGAVKLGFGRQVALLPARVCGRLLLRNVDRPV